MTSLTSHASLNADDFNLSVEEEDVYAIVKLRNEAFDAVHSLWKERESEGLRKQDIADFLGRDKGWVSRALRGPANWEFKTFARLVRALKGEVEIKVLPIEQRCEEENFHAYRDAPHAYENTIAKSDRGPLRLTGSSESSSSGNVFIRGNYITSSAV